MAGKFAKCPNGKVPARYRDDGERRASLGSQDERPVVA